MTESALVTGVEKIFFYSIYYRRHSGLFYIPHLSNLTPWGAENLFSYLSLIISLSLSLSFSLLHSLPQL